ncbi:MAG: CCA tRNA nucleotidyltransferase, partial [Thermoplasmatales archaeon]|nr:CCA tRNA nucleotidyltransferase [Thermoplasmatales archaeon]
MSLEEEMARRIIPSEGEAAALGDAMESLMAETRAYLEKNGIDAEPMFVGSAAKGTFLKDPDVDLFLMFPEGFPRRDMERLGLRAGLDLVGGGKMFADHPYIRGEYAGYEVDVVPCFAIKSTDRLLTSVDRTPFHTHYVLGNTDAAMRDQIRFLKAFMKGIGAYGAEPNRRGFSGYMCELLAIRYGGFRGAIEAGAKWRENVTISLGKKGAPMVAPIVLYDPVDPRRNVASAVHIDTLALYVAACRAYLKEPNEKFFFPAERVALGRDEIRVLNEKRGTKLITVVFERPEANEDNLHSQIWKTAYALARKLDAFTFNVVRFVHELGEGRVAIMFELERDTLSETHKHVGPPVWVESSERFLGKWRGNPHGEPFIEDGAWKVIAERPYVTAVDMLEAEAAISGIGRDIDPSTMTVLDHYATLRYGDAGMLTDLLDPRLPWD